MRIKTDAGSIPACAGEPVSPSPAHRTSQVYPRVCGGTLCDGDQGDAGSGLSPRVRGNLHGYIRAIHAEGSIPACAGEPSNAGRQTSAPGVYPRVCGGTIPGPRPNFSICGLSPRVRGNLMPVVEVKQDVGSIPACAGEPGSFVQSIRSSRVYPRVCGGTTIRDFMVTNLPGLSPRVRGNLPLRPVRLWPGGSIPACAGEPHLRDGVFGTRRVYPRVCGGTAFTSRSRDDMAGLSPRVRGNPSVTPNSGALSGSIPACAGEPRYRLSAAGRRRVYPRVCGGTFVDDDGHIGLWGLSPRVRGNQLAGQRTPEPSGSIPACAGEPCGRGIGALMPGVYPRVCGGTKRLGLSPSKA